MITGTYSDVFFEVSPERVLTFNSLKRKRKANFATHNILNNKALVQHTGLQPDTIRLQVIFNPQLGINPDEELNKLIKTLEKGKSRVLVIQNSYIGEFYLKKLSEKTDYKTRSIKVDLSLLEAHENFYNR